MLAALALLLASAQQSSPSLLEPPAGWATERIPFPLSFAPEIALEGHEDLAFAPGMFAPGSDSYFSYALALKLAGEVEVDEAFLDSFLESYYRGLCGAVAKDKGMEIDVGAITAEVRRDGARFAATVALFDSFTTGAALDLALEIEARPTPGATEVLGLASPLDREAPVWAELRGIAERWRAARPAPLHLNHAYLVVARETYDALVASQDLRALAVCEERETVRADGSYRGFYLYARRTYLEFLPEGAAGLPLGASGLAYGLEEAGAADALALRLAERKVPAQVFPITRALDGAELPWFRMLGVETPGGGAALSLFAMEYEPEFLARWHAGKPPAGGGIRREDVLERYAAALDASAQRESAPLVDLAQVRLALDDAQRERLLALSAAAAHPVEERGGGWVVRLPGCRLALERSEEPGGVVAVELALRAPLPRRSLELGSVLLDVHGRSATLALRR